MTDEEGHLVGLFWCDSQSQIDYAAFGDVVVFDSTYKTNRYNLPLVPFVGVNHHRRTVVFGCGLISHENIDSYVWLLRTFSDANAQKHPISVITDGDLAMERAIRIVWPNASHRLCGFHIERNLVRNVHNEKVKDAFRVFMYDRCSIEEIEMKWLAFLVKHEVTEESWIYQMYELRKSWCAAYHTDKCYLGLRSNQRSESMNARLKMHLNGRMTLLETVQHYESCLSKVRRKEAKDDSAALQSEPYTAPGASILEIDAKERFTPNIFVLVQPSIEAASKCEVSEIEDDDYLVCRPDKGGITFEVNCELTEEGDLKGISCSCRKMQSIGIPCSHIFHVLGDREERKLPDCCVLERWTMGAKSAFPPIRKSTMYEYSETLVRYRDLRNISRAASFVASSSTEGYERLKGVLLEETARIMPNGGANGSKMCPPVLPQALEADCEEFMDIMDPLHVPGRGTPKKKLKSTSNKSRAKVRCTLCKDEGHNRRTCTMREEDAKLPEDVVDG